MKQLTKLFLSILSITYLAGCATEHNINLPESFWQNPKPNIAIAKTKFEDKPSLQQDGQQGLLDLAISSVVTQEFNNYLKKTSLEWYEELPHKFVAQFKQRQIPAQVYSVDLTDKQKKNATVVVQIAGDKLLLLELQRLGAIRTYYSFIPTGAPKAYCILKGELIDRQDKKVLWRHLAKIEETVQGNWDQPPSYPNFTVALKQAIESAQDEVIDSFFSGH